MKRKLFFLLGTIGVLFIIAGLVFVYLAIWNDSNVEKLFLTSWITLSIGIIATFVGYGNMGIQG